MVTGIDHDPQRTAPAWFRFPRQPVEGLASAQAIDQPPCIQRPGLRLKRARSPQAILQRRPAQEWLRIRRQAFSDSERNPSRVLLRSRLGSGTFRTEIERDVGNRNNERHIGQARELRRTPCRDRPGATFRTSRTRFLGAGTVAASVSAIGGASGSSRVVAPSKIVLAGASASHCSGAGAAACLPSSGCRRGLSSLTSMTTFRRTFRKPCRFSTSL